MRRIVVSPKLLIDHDFVYAKMGDEDDIRELIYDTESKEIVSADFVKMFFTIEIKADQEDKIEQEIILHGNTMISFKPKYRPSSRYHGMGPKMSYEGFEYKKEFIQIQTFYKLFDIIEEK